MKKILYLLTFFSFSIQAAQQQQARQPRGECGDLFINLLDPIYNNKKVIGFIKRKHLYQATTLGLLVRAYYVRSELWVGIAVYMVLWMWYYCNYKWWEAEQKLELMTLIPQHMINIPNQVVPAEGQPAGFRPLVA